MATELPIVNRDALTGEASTSGLVELAMSRGTAVATFDGAPEDAAAPAGTHVALVRPTRVSSAGTWSIPVTPPLGLAYIAALLRSRGIEVSAVDALAENVDQFIRHDTYLFQGLTIEQTLARIDRRATVIGVSCMFTQDWPWIQQLIGAIRREFPSATIVAGGEHITALPEFCLERCADLDVCVLGEGEETMLELVLAGSDRSRWSSVAGLVYRDVSTNSGERIVRTPPRARIRAVDDLPNPAWDLFPIDVYLGNRQGFGVYRGRTMGVLATRGCPYKCTFCSNPQMYGNLWMPRDPGKLLDEIEGYIRDYDVTNIDFYDLTFVLRRSWILEFCRQIEERGLNFTWQLPSGTRSEVFDDEVAAALYRTGCRNLALAPESGSEETLKRVKKQVRLDRLTNAARVALRNKLHVKLNLVIGFPHDTRRDVLKTVWFSWKLAAQGVDACETMQFTPYPGTELFEELRRDGTIGALDDDYFRGLVAFLDPFVPSRFCKQVPGRELAFWRIFIMASTFAIGFALRPWRLARLAVNLVRDRSDTVLEHRLSALVRRPKIKTAADAASELAPQAASASAV